MWEGKELHCYRVRIVVEYIRVYFSSLQPKTTTKTFTHTHTQKVLESKNLRGMALSAANNIAIPFFCELSFHGLLQLYVVFFTRF